MIKVLAAAVLLVTLTACGSGADPIAKQAAPAAADKPLPFAPPPPPLQEEGGACTADVHQCPDGSFVSRNAAQGCSFDPCPDTRNPDTRNK